MAHTLKVPNGIITIAETDFECPKCKTIHTENDYYKQLYKSQKHYIYKSCKKCKVKIGITTDIMGDVRVWLKEEENK